MEERLQAGGEKWKKDKEREKRWRKIERKRSMEERLGLEELNLQHST